MNNLSHLPNAPLSRFTDADLGGTAVQIMLDVSEAVRAFNAADEGNPLQASELSFFDNFAEALGLEPESPLTSDLLPSVCSLGIESDSDEKHVRFSVPDGMTAELTESGSSVALRIASLEAPQSPILLVHEDFRIYADCVRPGLFAHAHESPELAALRRIISEADENLRGWISGMQITEVLNESDGDARIMLLSNQHWNWQNWDLFCANADDSEDLLKIVREEGAGRDGIAEALRSLHSALMIIRAFRSLAAPYMDLFVRS